jgi:two-component system, OmpR family, phosphate regulon sensor histidine kinase PhoR
MNIDVRTIIIIMGITNILQVIAVFIQFSINKTYKGIGWWLLGFIWVALGSGLIILREFLPYQTINIFATNVLLLSGPVFHYIGIMRFLDKKENRIFIISITTIFIVLFSLFFNDITLRSAIISSALSVMALFTAWSLFVNRMRAISVSTYLMIGLFLLQGGFFAFRATDLLIAAPLNSTFDSTTLQILAFMVPLIVGILITFSLIIMVNQRLNVEMTEAKERYEIVFNTSPDATVITKINDGCILNINQGFSALSGYTGDEVIGKASLNIWNDPADRQRIVNELKEKGHRENFEAIFRRKDGSTFFGLMSAKNINLHGVPHIVSITRDITERKKAEEKIRLNGKHLQNLLDLHRMADNTQKSIIDFMLEATTESLQSQFAFIGTLSPDEAVMTIHAWSKGAMEQCAVSEKPIHFAIAGAGLWGEVVRQRRPIMVNEYDTSNEYKKGYPRGHVPIKRFLSIPVFSGGKIVAVAAVANKLSEYDESDVNVLTSLLHEMWNLIEHKQAETKTIEIEALKRSNQVKADLLSNVSHELRTPLTSIKGNIETLLETDVEWSKEQQLEFLQVANRQADRLTLLIRDLLDMSRIDSGKLTLDKRSYLVSEILDSISGVLSVITAKHLLKIVSLPDLPSVQADKVRIAQVITNLVENAVKFSPEGSLIVINTGLNDSEIIISVEDSGIGMPPEIVEKLFDRFYQSYQVVKGKTNGTGLGLVICKGIVEAHGGKIRVESRAGKGSRFYFSIPTNNR